MSRDGTITLALDTAAIEWLNHHRSTRAAFPQALISELINRQIALEAGYSDPDAIHVMLDLETWGTEPGYDIRSIGACVFDPIYTGRDEQRFYVATDNPVIGNKAGGWLETLGFRPNTYDPCYDLNDEVYRKYPLRRDPQTVQWWNDQSDDAKAAFANPVDLSDALSLFGNWLYQLTLDVRHDPGKPSPALRLWSHGPAFDPPILAAAYRAVVLPLPWHYRAPRDTRTALELAAMDPHKALEQFNTGTHHHALDDAICQARAMCEAYRRLGWAL